MVQDNFKDGWQLCMYDLGGSESREYIVGVA